jgi:hypothetical protein
MVYLEVVVVELNVPFEPELEKDPPDVPVEDPPVSWVDPAFVLKRFICYTNFLYVYFCALEKLLSSKIDDGKVLVH